ncbi:uncharacterized protein LOC135430824 [Drosophila montana]|uniref:uncharacterized protein LOC135430824 n=1 Tax=Drosophila montana TaxID=40370 RepID=UPI00313F0CE7
MWSTNRYLWLIGLLLLLSCLQSVQLKKYVVRTDGCKIEDPYPYDAEVWRHFKRMKYTPCSTLQPLTRMEYNASSEFYQLHIDPSAFQQYLKIDLDFAAQSASSPSCCYMPVERVTEKEVDLGATCIPFQSGVQLRNMTIGFLVECYANGKRIYTNGHATVPERGNVRRRLQKWTEERGGAAPSVLLVAMDTISRQQLMRAMPLTRQYLQYTGWFELAGYNKVEDNTLPNVLPLTTGYNRNSVNRMCNPHEEKGLERCTFIWKLYQDLGYVTAFGEDDTPINTFNYLIKGFRQPPVDYYLRPYLMAAEQWLDGSGSQLEQDAQPCLGYRHAAEHVYEFALEFTRRYRNDSFFGFFWTNTHSHGNSISRTSAMDRYMRTFWKRMFEQGTMEQTIVFFLSDHGLLDGSTRRTPLGWLEERLPFLYIWLPPHLRQSHPEFVEALSLNRQRLTSPFDVFVTLKHILRLASPNDLAHLVGDAVDCPSCQSLLQPVPLGRTCADAGIPEHWCTCRSYHIYSRYTSADYLMAQLMVQHINALFEKYGDGKYAGLCKPLTLMNITRASIARLNNADNPRISIHRIQIQVEPTKSIFEATLSHNTSSQNMVISGFSRLDEQKPFCYGEKLQEFICDCR